MLPSGSLSLHDEVRARLEAEFGQPNHVLGADAHWRLRPRPVMASINILLNGDLQHPALWIFDPHDLESGVVNASVRSMAEADELIRQIQHRVERAALKRT